MLKLIVLLLVLIAPCYAEPRWSEALPKSLAEQPIRTVRSLEETLKAQGKAWDGSSEIWFVELQDGTQAVFRSEDEPWGSQAEVAGFQLSRWLDMELVPPTATRTLQRADWPAAKPWPFPENSRTGSVQLYVPSHSITDQEWEALDPLNKADIEVLSFVMGRYDNHSGNLLIDQQGQPVMVDFENCLEIQKARYGEIAYARRGTRCRDRDSLTASQPFPFDHPQLMVNPSLEMVQQTFSPWWTHWREGMKGTAERARQLDDKTLRYAIWDHYLWVQVRARSRHACWTERYRHSTMEKLASLDLLTLQAILPAPFGKEHAQGMLERAGQVQQAWKNE